MIEALGRGTRLGYCTNVHAGHDLRSTLENLERHAVAVREELNVSELGVGLWLAAEAAGHAVNEGDWIRDRLRELGLRVFTINGFPFSNFHEPVVKHRVYVPDWGDARRTEYTLRLVEVLDEILDEGEEGSISTVPLGWPGSPCPAIDMHAAGNHLRAVARRLHDLERDTGRLIHVDIEPEPGCSLQRSGDVVKLFEDLLRGNPEDEHAVRRYLRVCHDVCHSAVMFEPQEEAFARYAAAGILVGKVQISSALAASSPQAVLQLSRFVEPRYLHQTCVRSGGRVHEYEDLPIAMRDGDRRGEWRVHFHVPVYLSAAGELCTTQNEIRSAVGLALAQDVRHFEVETYAWTVLPEEMRPGALSSGIAEEIRWVMSK